MALGRLRNSGSDITGSLEGFRALDDGKLGSSIRVVIHQ